MVIHFPCTGFLIKKKINLKTLKRLPLWFLIIWLSNMIYRTSQVESRTIPWKLAVHRQILGKCQRRVFFFQKKLNDMQHDSSPKTPHCLNCDVSFWPPKWAYSHCRLGESGENQSKWPVDRVHHVIPAASALRLTNHISDLTRYGSNRRGIILKYLGPLLSNKHMWSLMYNPLPLQKAFSYTICDSLTQGVYCSQRFMYMFTLHPVLHYSPW